MKGSSSTFTTRAGHQNMAAATASRTANNPHFHKGLRQNGLLPLFTKTPIDKRAASPTK